ncbi:MAG: hypothetical protein JXQ30_05755 [Spirochaetes bacterium]|nr:hypothetical protein [Spirochaetota bacterium]
MKRTVVKIGIVAISILLLGILFSCGEEGGGTGPVTVTYTLVFVDQLSGDAVPGVVVYMNGEAKTAGADGKVSSSADGPIRLEGYIDPVTLYDLGFEIIDPIFYFYFAFTVDSSFSRTVILEPLPDSPAGYVIYGSVAGIVDGYMEVYSSGGRNLSLGEIDITDGSYEGTVYDTGVLYFVIHDGITGGEVLYYTTVEVAGDGEYNIAYDGTDIALAGDVSDTAGEVVAYLTLGEELIELNSEGLDSPFSIEVSHMGTDEIRLMAEGNDSEGHILCYSGGYSAAASGIDLSFAGGGTVPAVWDSGFGMTGPGTFSWNAAGNADAYTVQIMGVGDGTGVLLAFVEGTSLTIDESIDLSFIEVAIIIPMRTEGYVGISIVGPEFRFVPASLIRGTTKYYMAIQNEWTPPD